MAVDGGGGACEEVLEATAKWRISQDGAMLPDRHAMDFSVRFR
jgi:hypothetical protein